MVHITFSLKEPGTECVTLTTNFLHQQLHKTMYFLSEEFLLILMSN